MIVAIDWLKDFVEIKETPQELADMLTMLGLEAEAVTAAETVENVVTARVSEVNPHPNADRLKLCLVDDGSATHQVICGAPNVYAGQISLLARVGAVLPGGQKIKKARLRGSESFGMLCSERELKLSDSHEGILDLPSDTALGLDANELFPQPLAAIEFEITPNRPDCLSHYGIAREIALKTGRELHPLSPRRGKENANDVEDFVDIIIDDSEGCPRYIAGIVENIKVGPSPDWMVQRLEAAGQRSINNIVDISNYVLLELGHPNHIFDYRHVPTKKVVIRRAGKGETITTLDDIERKLDDQHLLITDGEQPIAIAGIMGGELSGVTDDTTTVLIESAYFDPVRIRKGSKSLGLMTEASRRFERGADPQATEDAFWRVVNLLEELADGQAVPGMIDAYPRKVSTPLIKLRKTELDLIAGCEISNDRVTAYLSGLGIEWQQSQSDEWLCTPPSFRPDLEREIDLIEEIIRVYGYDNVPVIPNYSGVYDQSPQDTLKPLTHIVNIMVGLGFNQCYSNSLQGAEVAGSLGQIPVELMNPLSEEMSHMRTDLLTGLLKADEFNRNNGHPNNRLFEIGQVFTQTQPGFKGIVEEKRMAGLISGTVGTQHFHDSEPAKQSFFHLKGYLEALFVNLDISGVIFKPNSETAQFSHGFDISLQEEELGSLGIINPDYLKKIGLEETGALIGFEINADRLLDIYTQTLEQRRYQRITVFPAVARDINLVLDDNIMVEQVSELVENISGNLLKKIAPMDIFRHKSLGSGKKSITFRVEFQSSERTLTDDDIAKLMDKIIAEAENKLGAELRT